MNKLSEKLYLDVFQWNPSLEQFELRERPDTQRGSYENAIVGN